MQTANFLQFVAKQLVRDLEPAQDFRLFTHNPVLKGAYVEAAVRQFVRRMVLPFRVCRGGIVDNLLAESGEALKSLDTIIWCPNPAPAIFEVGDFAMVPRSSAFGILEIKTSNYSGALEDIRERTSVEFQKKHLWPENASAQAMGVICINDGTQLPNDLTDQKRIIALFDLSGDTLIARQNDVFTLVNFLASIISIAKNNWATMALPTNSVE